MSERETEEAVARLLTASGYRTVTTEQWSRQGALDVLREQRRRHAGSPRIKFLDKVASAFADRLTEHADVSPRDMATVLLVAGASVGALAVMHDLPGRVVSEILQITADELDRRANGGETS